MLALWSNSNIHIIDNNIWNNKLLGNKKNNQILCDKCQNTCNYSYELWSNMAASFKRNKLNKYKQKVRCASAMLSVTKTTYKKLKIKKPKKVNKSEKYK